VAETYAADAAISKSSLQRQRWKLLKFNVGRPHTRADFAHATYKPAVVEVHKFDEINAWENAFGEQDWVVDFLAVHPNDHVSRRTGRRLAQVAEDEEAVPNLGDSGSFAADLQAQADLSGVTVFALNGGHEFWGS
jgi:hypothetical protein